MSLYLSHASNSCSPSCCLNVPISVINFAAFTGDELKRSSWKQFGSLGIKTRLFGAIKNTNWKRKNQSKHDDQRRWCCNSVYSVATSNVQPNGESTMEQLHYLNNRSNHYGGNQTQNNLPTHYNPGLRYHENFSYANNKNVLNPPTGHASTSERKPSLEDTLHSFIAESRSRSNQLENAVTSLSGIVTSHGAAIKNIETQIGQMNTSLQALQARKETP